MVPDPPHIVGPRVPFRVRTPVFRNGLPDYLLPRRLLPPAARILKPLKLKKKRRLLNVSLPQHAVVLLPVRLPLPVLPVMKNLL